MQMVYHVVVQYQIRLLFLSKLHHLLMQEKMLPYVKEMILHLTQVKLLHLIIVVLVGQQMVMEYLQTQARWHQPTFQVVPISGQEKLL